MIDASMSKYDSGGAGVASVDGKEDAAEKHKACVV